MGLISAIRAFFDRLFPRDPDNAHRRAELKRIHAELATLKPPYYRPKQNLILPAFAQALYSFCVALRPFTELALATVAAQDARVALRFFDQLIEARLSEATRTRKSAFTYESMLERIRDSLDPSREIDAISDDFQGLLGEMEVLSARDINIELNEVDRFIEICRHDYERLLGLFDPGVTLDAANYRPDFSPAEGEQAFPELIDLYYIFSGFSFSAELRANLLRLLERKNPNGIDEAKRKVFNKLVDRCADLLGGRLESELLLGLARAAKGDPDIRPSTIREPRDFVEAHKRRFIQQFEKDRELIQRERHENAVAIDIKNLFGNEEVLEIEGYTEETDAYLRRESPNGFSYIKPLRILKTFIDGYFETSIKEPVKKILVEGYFDNKNFQNNLANILYQVERSGGRIREFEDQLLGNGRVSIVAMKRYVEEMRRGKDIASFLNRLVDAINGRAKDIVEDEGGLLAMLGGVLSELVADFRRSSPDFVSNIRTFGGARNKEIMAQIQMGRDRIAILVKVLKNFTYVHIPIAGSIAAKSEEGAEPKPKPEIASPDEDDTEVSEVEEL